MSLDGPQRLLVDGCIPDQVVAALRERGHDVLWVAELTSPPTDLELLQMADDQNRNVITIDPYISELCLERHVIRRGKAGIVWLKPAGLAELTERALEAAFTIPCLTWTLFKPRFVLRESETRQIGGEPKSPGRRRRASRSRRVSRTDGDGSCG